MMSAGNSALKCLEHLAYGAELRQYQLRHPPVFIVGHWRSGTTLLHELLSKDPRLICPNLYQVLSPHHCLLSEPIVAPLTAWMLPRTRPMDEVAVSWQTPQEDETALCNLTGMSPYMMLAYQGQRWKYERFFELQQMTETEQVRWKTAFLTFLKRVALRSEKASGRANPESRLLLKSPTHSYRIRLLLEMFPNSKFIHIVRNPYDVFNSAMYLRERLFESNALGRPRHDGAEEDVYVMYDHLFQALEADRHLLKPEQFHELRFEDLETNPIEEVERIYIQLELDGFETVKNKLAGQLDAHRRFRKNKFKMDDGLRRRVYDRWRRTFDQYEYPSGLTAASIAGKEEIPCGRVSAQTEQGRSMGSRTSPLGVTATNA